MKINFTKKEYRRLLGLVYLGDWMLNAHKVGPDDRDRGYDEVLQKIYAQAEAMGCEELISDSQMTEGFAPTLTFEESGIDEVIGEYNDSIFWEELIDRLSARDALSEAELKGHSISSIGEFFEWVEPHEEKYAKEIDDHGLTRLGVWSDGKQVWPIDCQGKCRASQAARFLISMGVSAIGGYGVSHTSSVGDQSRILLLQPCGVRRRAAS